MTDAHCHPKEFYQLMPPPKMQESDQWACFCWGVSRCIWVGSVFSLREVSSPSSVSTSLSLGGSPLQIRLSHHASGRPQIWTPAHCPGAWLLARMECSWSHDPRDHVLLTHSRAACQAHGSLCSPDGRTLRSARAFFFNCHEVSFVTSAILEFMASPTIVYVWWRLPSILEPLNLMLGWSMVVLTFFFPIITYTTLSWKKLINANKTITSFPQTIISCGE